MKLLKKLWRITPIGAVQHAIHSHKEHKKEAQQAKNEADAYKAEVTAEREENKRKTEIERKRARKLSLRSMRTKRTASYYLQGAEQAKAAGSKTVG